MDTIPIRLRSLAIATLAMACLSSSLVAQTRTPAETRTEAPSTAPRALESRDSWQRVPDIFAALGARPGSRIADFGAGEGWLTTRLAKHVGPGGRVFAVDISERALERLSEAVAADTLRNVELILSEADDPRLPYRSLDGVVIVNAYHEMTQRGAILDGIKRGLRPEGLLVIVDNAPADSVTLRQRQMANHTLSIDFAEDDLQSAGFEVVKRVPDFIVRTRDRHSHKEWMLVARPVRK